jgi:FAD/FMN-containing dehydrogenase
LARELETTLQGRIEGEVRFDAGSRAAYATDHSIYRAVPVGVVIPRKVEDVIATVAACHARVEPGVINDTLRNAAKAHGLTFAPDPATHQWCTLGGNIGNNSCGAHTVMGGKTVDNVEALEILTYDGCA